MLYMTLSREERNELKRLQWKFRWDRLIPFSVNSRGRTWAFGAWGRTPEESRKEVGCFSGKLDEITGEYLRLRESGGRFFVGKSSVFYKDQEKNQIEFVVFAS